MSFSFLLHRRARHSSRAILLALLTVGLGAQTWDGGGSNSQWSTKQNWNPNTVPANGANVIFRGTFRTTPNLDSARTVNSLTFASGAAAFNLSSTNGSTLTVGTGGLVQASTNGQAIGAALNLGSSQTWTVSGGSLMVTAPISSGYITLTKAGAGSLTLSGNNAGLQGPLAVNAGTVVAASSSALGNATYGNTVASGASLGLQGSVILTEGDLTLAGAGVGGGGALRNLSGTNTLAADLKLGADATAASDAGTLTLANAIATNGHTLTLAGAGAITTTQSLDGGFVITSGAGARTLNGPLNAGFTVNGSGAVAVNGNINAGTAAVILGGIGPITLAGAQLNAGNVSITNAGATLFSTQINAGGAFTQSGPGSTTLAGTGTNYLNSVTVTGGELVLNQTGGPAVQVTGGSAIMLANADLIFEADNQIAAFNDLTLATGATVDLGGTTQTLSDLVILGDSIVDFGSAGSTLDLDTLSFIADATLTLANWTFGSDGLHTNTNPGPAALARIVFADSAGATWNPDGSITPRPNVSEPATYGMISLGGMLTYAVWRRRGEATI